MRIEFLLEEQSMANFLEIILPKILPHGFVLNENCFLRPHRGKSDLQKSIPRKIKVFSRFHEQAKIVIIHDQDSSDCVSLKTELEQLCHDNGDCPVLIRIACRELESWYLGDMDAIESVYHRFKADKYRNTAKFRNPDVCNPSDELAKIIPEFQQGYASKTIPKYMNISQNNSESFTQFVRGLSKFIV